MGVVYEASHLRLGHSVAVKVLHRQHVQHDFMRVRFDREAKALAALKHPNIVSIIDYGIADDMPYLVMELLEGRTLQEYLDEGRPPVGRAMEIARQLLQGLAYAHGEGLVHRDLKPGNIFLQKIPGTDREELKILDFGFVKFTDAEPNSPAASATQSGMLFGTMGYMPPEQIAGGESGAYSDVYAVGVLMFELLTGRRPFEGEPQEIVRQSFTSPPPSLSTACPSLEPLPELELCVQKALAKDGNDRYPDAIEFLAAVEALPALPVKGEAFALAATMFGDKASKDPSSRVKTGPFPTGRHALQAAHEAEQRRKRGVGSLLLLILCVTGGSIYFALDRGYLAMGERAPQILQEIAPSGDDPEGQGPSGVGLPSQEELRDVVAGARVVVTEGVAITRDAIAEGVEVTGAVVEEIQERIDESAPPAVVAEAPQLPPDPWLRRPLSNRMNTHHRLTVRGRTLSANQVKATRRYARSHRADPLPHLVLAQHYANRGIFGGALQQYAIAYADDPGSIGDPRMLQDMVLTVKDGAEAERAAEQIEAYFGRGAIGTVATALNEPTAGGPARERLQSLLETLTPLPAAE